MRPTIRQPALVPLVDDVMAALDRLELTRGVGPGLVGEREVRTLPIDHDEQGPR
ncbi:hypothetical protein GALL_347560 [mine drainage metagenome]|uniref:Uncharacterized protein n=1 Tax=mine drainage metagenome TaxID=410659 RepID=A0A1J5QJH2_9ZZZZ